MLSGHLSLSLSHFLSPQRRCEEKKALSGEEDKGGLTMSGLYSVFHEAGGAASGLFVACL